MDDARAKAAAPAPTLPEPLAKAARRTPSNAKAVAAHHFDKAFPVFLSSDRGVANGVGRNITPEGMFIETRDPCPIGTELRVTFEAASIGAEFTAVAVVRFQAFLNYAGREGDAAGLRGVGVRFVSFVDDGRAAISSVRQ